MQLSSYSFMYREIRDVLNGIIKVSIATSKQQNPPENQKAPGSVISLLMFLLMYLL